MMKLLVVAVCLAYASARHSRLVDQMSVVSADVPSGNDFGVFTNCGSSKVSGVWTPKVVSSHGEVTVYINFTAPYYMDGGYAEVDIFRHSDHSIIAEYGTPFGCEDVKQWIPCPITKGQVISIKKTIPDLSALAKYQGVLDVIAQISNNDDQQMLCVNATVTVSG